MSDDMKLIETGGPQVYDEIKKLQQRVIALPVGAKIVPKVWGHEHIVVNTETYCGKIMVLREGFMSSIHYHKIKDEYLYVSGGRVRFELEDVIHVLQAGEGVRVLPGQRHRFAGLSESIIIEFSTHDDPEDSYRLTESGVLCVEKP